MNSEHYLKTELYKQVTEDASIFDFIQQGALDGIWYWDLQNPENEWMSPRFWTALGYNPDNKQHLASEWQDLIFKADLDRAIENFTRHCKDPSYPYDQVVRYRHKDGSIVWIRCRGMAIRDPGGTPVRMLGAHTDLTKQKQAQEQLRSINDTLEQRVAKRTAELADINTRLTRELFARKKTEKALKESESRYRSMMNAMKDAAYICSSDFRIEYMNPAMEKIIGQKALGKFCFEAIHGLGEQCPWCTQEKIQKRQSVDVEVVSPKSGRSYLISNSPFIHEDGTVSKMAVYRDTTDLKRLENQLRQAQKMQAIGTLAGGVAHDFNNILTAIIGNADLVLMEKTLTDPVREEIEEIKMSGNRAAELTRQLLAFSRKQVIQPKTVNLNTLLARLKKMLNRLIGENIDILFAPKEDLWQVKMDRVQMEQVVINLVVNARDAMPDGGKLTIETANIEIDEAYLYEHGLEQSTGPYILLAISDTGSGMDKVTQDRIFEPFFTTKALGKGTGLGLSSIYGIVKQNRGFIWVYSELGQGSTFKIYLPRTVREDIEVEVAPTPVNRVSGTETVLIVEDDNRLRKVVCTVLKQFGYKVVEAQSGKEAIASIHGREDPVDLIITDVVMPNMNGKETAAQVEALQPGIKVIFMSGYTDNAIVHHGVLTKGLNFLEKPFSPETLLKMVRKVMGGTKGHRAAS